jgi:hypothetical protein
MSDKYWGEQKDGKKPEKSDFECVTVNIFCSDKKKKCKKWAIGDGVYNLDENNNFICATKCEEVKDPCKKEEKPEEKSPSLPARRKKNLKKKSPSLPARRKKNPKRKSPSPPTSTKTASPLTFSATAINIEHFWAVKGPAAFRRLHK